MGVAVTPTQKYMFPQLYQKVFETHLNPRQYLTLQLLVLMLQSYRDVSLSTLANKFPQLIKYESRVRNLQRFLDLPQLTAKLLWFPIIKQLLKQEFRSAPGNRKQRRRVKKLQLIHQGHLFLIIDRTQWQERNLIVLSLAWGQHAIPEKGTCIADDNAVYLALKDLDIKPGTSRFYVNISCTKAHQIGDFNLAAYWKRKYRGRQPKEPWYILTSFKSLPRTLCVYAARWGIETMFRDLKTGGYNLENTKVNARRLMALVLLITIAYTLATLQGASLQHQTVAEYICRPTETGRSTERYSTFWMGLHAPDWGQSFQNWSDLAWNLMNLKPHKRLNFQQGIRALSLIQSAL